MRGFTWVVVPRLARQLDRHLYYMFEEESVWKASGKRCVSRRGERLENAVIAFVPRGHAFVPGTSRFTKYDLMIPSVASRSPAPRTSLCLCVGSDHGDMVA